MNKYFKESKYTYVLGISLVVEALKNRHSDIKEVYLSSNVIHNKEYDSLISLCEKYHISYFENDKVINSLSTKENCYGIAVINKYESQLTPSTHLLLKDFNDEGELGTIIRSLASFNFKDLALINSNIDIYDPKVIRSSMGGYFHINIVKYDSLEEYRSHYNKSIVSIGLSGKTELKKYKHKGDCSVLIDKNKDSDYYIEHKKESNLNDSSICTIVLNHLFNQI